MVNALSQKQIRDGWEIVRFGEIARNISERVDPTTTDLNVYVGLEHLDPQSLRITRKGTPKEVKGQKLRVKPGQIIFGKRRAYQKKVAVADFNGICSAHAMVLEAVPGKIIPELLPFFMQSDMFMDRAVAISEGSLSPTIKWKTLAIQEFPLPPIERQNKLLKILIKLESTNHQYISVINSAKKAQNVLTNKLILKPKNDKDFTKGKIEQFFELQRGFDLTKTQVAKGNIPVFSSSGISYYHNQGMLTGESVITGRKGKLGDVYYAIGDCWPHDTTLFVKNFKGNSPRFIFWFLKSIKLERYNAASAVPTLNRNVVHKITVKFPKIEKQLKISNYLNEFDKTINDYEAKYRQFSEMRQQISNQLLNSKT